MKHTNTIFHHLLRLVPRHQFERAVDRYNGDYQVRHLNCWTQLCIMIFTQLTQRQSLRDVEAAFNSQANHHYHLGLQPVRRSTLSDANASRPLAIYQEIFYQLLGKVRESTAKEASQAIRLIDSTTIDLNQRNFSWAKFRSSKSAIKLHVVYDPAQSAPTFFTMTEAKLNDRKGADLLPIISNAKDEVVQSHAVDENVLADQTIRLTSTKGQQCPISLRRIHFIRQEDQKEIILISNNTEASASKLMVLYKQR